MNKENKLPHVGIHCLLCGWVGVSWWVHDYKTCSCDNRAMIDGGYDYTRYGAMSWDNIRFVTISKVKVTKPKKRKKEAK